MFSTVSGSLAPDMADKWEQSRITTRFSNLKNRDQAWAKKWQCHFGCECLPTSILQVQAQQVQKYQEDEESKIQKMLYE